MDAHEDPAHDTVTGSTGALLMAATVAAERVARHWRNQAERQATQAGAEAKRWQQRYGTQRQLAALDVSAADQRWVDNADV